MARTGFASTLRRSAQHPPPAVNSSFWKPTTSLTIFVCVALLANSAIAAGPIRAPRRARRIRGVSDFRSYTAARCHANDENTPQKTLVGIKTPRDCFKRCSKAKNGRCNVAAYDNVQKICTFYTECLQIEMPKRGFLMAARVDQQTGHWKTPPGQACSDCGKCIDINRGGMPLRRCTHICDLAPGCGTDSISIPDITAAPIPGNEQNGNASQSTTPSPTPTVAPSPASSTVAPTPMTTPLSGSSDSSASSDPEVIVDLVPGNKLLTKPPAHDSSDHDSSASSDSEHEPTPSTIQLDTLPQPTTASASVLDDSSAEPAASETRETKRPVKSTPPPSESGDSSALLPDGSETRETNSLEKTSPPPASESDDSSELLHAVSDTRETNSLEKTSPPPSDSSDSSSPPEDKDECERISRQRGYPIKRGLSVPPPVKEDEGTCYEARALRLSCTWYYNWGFLPRTLGCPEGARFAAEFVPMVWGCLTGNCTRNFPDDWREQWEAAGVNTLMGFNEPDSPNMADMTPYEAAKYWPQVDAVARSFSPRLKLVGPGMTHWRPEDGSSDWLDEFFDHLNKLHGPEMATRIDFLAQHDFTGNIQNIMDKAKALYRKYGRKIYLTEFAVKAKRTKGLRAPTNDFLKKALPHLDNLYAIERYAWFSTLNDAAESIYVGESSLIKYPEGVNKWQRNAWSSRTTTGDIYAAPEYTDYKYL